VFRLDLLTDHELETSKSLEINESVFEFMESFLFFLTCSRAMNFIECVSCDVVSSVAVLCFGALCPEGRLALVADICAFWRGPSGFSRWKDLSFPEAPSGLRRR